MARSSAGLPLGAIAGLFTRSIFNRKVVLCGEVFWYVVPKARGSAIGGKLFLEYEKAGKTAAHGITMTLLDTSPGMDDNLKKRGFVQKERSYVLWQ